MDLGKNLHKLISEDASSGIIRITSTELESS